MKKLINIKTAKTDFSKGLIINLFEEKYSLMLIWQNNKMLAELERAIGSMDDLLTHQQDKHGSQRENENDT